MGRLRSHPTWAGYGATQHGPVTEPPNKFYRTREPILHLWRVMHGNLLLMLGALILLLLNGCARALRNTTDTKALIAPGISPGPLSADTRSIEVRLSLSSPPESDLEVKIPIEKNVNSRPGRQIRTDFPGIPINLPVSTRSPGEWTLGVPVNTLQLLSRQNETVTYTGKLILEPDEDPAFFSPRQEFPLQLVIERRSRAKPAHRRARHRTPVPNAPRSAG